MGAVTLVFLGCLVSWQFVLAASCQIAFRMDDIQDYYLRAPQLAIMNRFYASKIPLTVGVIANYFGEDQTMVGYLKMWASDWKMAEVASHGWNHERITLYSYEDQVKILGDAKARIEKVMKSTIPPIVSVIMPYDEYNSDTIRAMNATGYRYISAGDLFEVCPWPNSAPPFRFHYGASTSTIGANLHGVPAQETLTGVQQQLLTCNSTAVIMMHPQEFGAPNGGVNETQLAQLDLVLQLIPKLGCDLKLLRDLKDPLPLPYPQGSFALRRDPLGLCMMAMLVLICLHLS
jgi:peptidoglycan/xylan/chitin deacetylase (PgdA/CDA1 family)